MHPEPLKTDILDFKKPVKVTIRFVQIAKSMTFELPLLHGGSLLSEIADVSQIFCEFDFKAGPIAGKK